MQATNDLRAILNAAEQAAAREDAASAERLLREALALQESTAGSPREEIAKTLNNLAVVCEMTGKTADAETCYRRAYTIATATLPASDPFVTTSRENLAQFCTSQGIPFERPAVVAARAPSPDPPTPAPAPEPVPTAPPPRAAVPAPPRAAPAVPRPQPQPARVASPIPAPSSTPSSSRAIAIGIFVLVALVIGFAAVRYWFAPSASPARATPVSQSEPAPAPAPTPPSTVTREPEPIAAAAAPAPAATTRPEPPRTTAPSSGPALVTAQVCRSLSVADGSWRCDVVSGSTAPGPLYFFTRVASARDTTIEHRWYRDDRLYQQVELDIRANQSGFRTYSRTTVSPDRAGNWRVELRTADGRVLHQETFSVR